MQQYEVGSENVADIVAEYLEYAIQHILCTRMVYPKSSFMEVHKFSMSLEVLKDPHLKVYVDRNIKKARDLLASGHLQRCVLVIAKISTGEVVERWQFSMDDSNSGMVTDLPNLHNKITQSLKQVGVCFLPPLDADCSFKILLYTDKSAKSLGESLTNIHPHLILHGSGDSLEMRSVDFPRWRLHTAVSYFSP
ncbi:mitotic spindle assembly checkpoint protein MAD2A-like [Paramacrobiotus metropolitanus]|uniref:mitotic spindle assembly checkpoint protein MAD2A-like n=1 Tax=Paramacrobiotus metropolitanus TaxID=2943436 RepID=UPI002445BF3C|nr:mitotic spindle assembly checkpoint protein MAD2A-like [Paramacrobiotus metropolitanus]